MWAKGLRYRKNRRVHGARPDFSFSKAGLGVFVDGCFWHGCPIHYSAPAGNAEFWLEKVCENRVRDERDNESLLTAGWRVLRFWECDINDRLHEVVDAIIESLNSQS